jgi:hypothetical protein
MNDINDGRPEMIYTTLNKIREHKPCADGWKKLLDHLGKTQADDEPLPLLTILESNGLNDALWCLKACDGIEKESRLFAVACARRVQHLMKDPRSLDALDVAERHAHGNATNQELGAAWAAAVAAREAAGYAAMDSWAAWAAANAAAWAAREAAANAARAAAWAAANAAWEAAVAAKEAAGYAEGAAAWAAEDAEIEWQEAEFRRVFCNEKAEDRTCA